jgi:hypothetical protein
MNNECKPINIINIVKEYLIDNGYDGLYHPIETCGCVLREIAPCEGCVFECRPGYKIKTPVDHDQYGETEWIISPAKQ